MALANGLAVANGFPRFLARPPWWGGDLQTVRNYLQRGRPLNLDPHAAERVEFPMADEKYRRPAMPYGLWMLQRALDAVRAMPSADVASVRRWLTEHGAQRLLDIQIPRLRRAGLCAAPAHSQLGDRLAADPSLNPRTP